VNRVPTDESGQPILSPQLEGFINDRQLKLAGVIPMDPLVAEFDTVGRPLIELPRESPARQAVEATFRSLDGLL